MCTSKAFPRFPTGVIDRQQAGNVPMCMVRQNTHPLKSKPKEHQEITTEQTWGHCQDIVQYFNASATSSWICISPNALFHFPQAMKNASHRDKFFTSQAVCLISPKCSYSWVHHVSPVPHLFWLKTCILFCQQNYPANKAHQHCFALKNHLHMEWMISAGQFRALWWLRFCCDGLVFFS